MKAEQREILIHRTFVISLFVKAFDAVIQVVAGFILLFTGKATDVLIQILHHELVEDPNDFIASHIASLLTHITSSSQYFFAWYLLSHGVIKMFLVWALIRNKIWAYPVSLFVLVGFILYQVARFTETHSVFLVLLTIFDIGIFWLVWHEYKYLLRHHGKSAEYPARF